MKSQSEFFKAKLEYETDPSDLKDSISKGEAIVIVDARSADAYKREHIPGALNLPHRTMNHDSTASLDKSKTYVSYCDGIGCNASTKGAFKLAELGFNVKELIGGLEWWKREGYETHGSKAQVDSAVSCNC
jgi:rhodanese-related sulfurtransferase